MIQKKTIEDAIDFAKKKLQDAPKGSLNVKKMNGMSRYYLNNGKKQVFLKKGDEILIKSLQEKNYYMRLLKASENNLKNLSKIRKLESGFKSFEDVFFNIPENKRNLIKPYVPSELLQIREKIEKELTQVNPEDFRFGKSVDKKIQFVTLNGERVRSKSELIIADRLKVANIRYLYESQFILADSEVQEFDVWFPDFQVFSERTGERLFWEHFGLMDNPEYCASCQYKIETYAKYGIVQGKNLIITMESSKHGLNTEYVDRLIQELLK